MNLQKNIKMFFKTKKVLLITYSKIFKTWILLYKNDFYKENYFRNPAHKAHHRGATDYCAIFV